MDFKIAVHAVHSVRLFLIPFSKTILLVRTVEYFTAACKICRQIDGWYAKPAYRSVQKAGLPYQAVHRRLDFAVPKSMLVKSVKIFAAGRTHCTIR